MNEQILEVLENRVTQLEKICGINSENVAETIRGPSISQQITSLDEQLNRHLTDGTKKSLKSQLKKYETQREYIEQVWKDPTFLLSLGEKMKLLSINEENIDNTIKDLEKLQELTKYLDFPPMVEINEKLKVIEPIEMEFAEKSNQYLAQDEKFKNVLEVYNQSIRDINLHFMYLESLVTQLENKK